MRRLSFIIVLVAIFQNVQPQSSPHGKDFKIDCVNCHSADDWRILKEEMVFDHSKTGFKLDGQHKTIGCKSCHESLTFSKEKNQCNDCHVDLHNNTLGFDCARCHTPKSWIVQNPTQLHQQSRFPLLGSHTTTDCFNCHKAASTLQFEPLSIECVNCHMPDYTATTAPNHQQSGYSTNCTDCHSAKSVSWTSAEIDHSFFPLNGGHSISCNECHTSGTFEKLPKECISCHQTNYNSTQNPNHQQLGFSTICTDCHDLTPGWKPAKYTQHDSQFFPIYSGEHNGEWNSCTDCHTNTASYAEFTCISCHDHNQSEMDSEHNGVNGYSYKSNLCYACHPRGSADGSLNHSTFGFTLTGAHLTTDCISCHTSGYANTPSTCVDCHQADYNKTLNPNHTEVNFPVDCQSCHSTNSWQPATFNHNSTGYPLTGAHNTIASNCTACHNGNYTTTPNACNACHQADYNKTTNPSHVTAQFPTDCETCHNTTGWQPSTFNHDSKYFPIYSGKHQGEWNSCVDCHKVPSNFASYSCIDCHEHNQADMNSKHRGESGYSYNSTACYSCHPRGNN